MRRLAAIMFTDIVGYSALAQLDEALSLELLEEHRNILRPLFGKHDGQEIETAGDSFFVEFSSAVEAANCAIEIQTALHERNKGHPNGRHINLRIGLHIGDVVHVDRHVHGDGVNIAARIQSVATSGCICVSEDIARQIRNKIDLPVVKTGKGQLKNITLPVDIYSIVLPWQKSGSGLRKKFVHPKPVLYGVGVAFAVAMAVLYLFPIKEPLPEFDATRLRVAVLPLVNISAQKEDEYFADGLTVELISSLSKISDLKVIARSSTMKYKNLSKDINEIGRELMVGSILEGSVRKVADKARISVKLVDVGTQENLWSMDYDRELRDIFMIQYEIAQNVAEQLKVILAPPEKEQLEKHYTVNTSAYQEYLIGKHFLSNRTQESIEAARNHFEMAILLDSGFALPYADLAYCYTLIGAAGYGSIPKKIAEQKARSAVMRALEIDPSLAEAHAALGYIKFRIDWDWGGADKEFMEAIRLKPGYATAHEWYALFLGINLRLDEALREIQIAHELDPMSSSVNTGLGRIYEFRNETDRAVTQFQKTIELDAGYAEAYFGLAAMYLKSGDYTKAEAAAKQALQLSGGRPVIAGFLGGIYAQTGNDAEAYRILQDLEAPPVSNDKLYAQAIILHNQGRLDEALDILEKLLEERYGLLIYSNVEQEIFKLGNERFERIIQKMNFMNRQ